MSKIIAIDFDGTIVDHRFPDIGMPVPGAFDWMRRFQECGARLILWTMRSDMRSDGVSPEKNKADRDYLGEAVAFCRSHGIEFWGINQNPEQASWTQSPKVYAHIYIDDAAHGTPLREMPRSGSRLAVDWDEVGPSVMSQLESTHA